MDPRHVQYICLFSVGNLIFFINLNESNTKTTITILTYLNHGSVCNNFGDNELSLHSFKHFVIYRGGRGGGGGQSHLPDL